MSRKCKVCKSEFTPRLPMATVCSMECAKSLAVSVRGKLEKQKAIKERKEDRAKLEKMKSTGKLIAEAQTAFNSFIRARDHGKPCICCGKPFEPSKPGGSVDAGHYRSRGSAPHLRFDERNCHAQRKNCNRPGGTTHAAFRAGMIHRIGIVELEQLESDQSEKKYTHDDLRAIKAEYSAKARELRKAME